MRIQRLLTKKPIIGMIHLLPLPGSPNYKGDINVIVTRALAEAQIYKRGSVDGVIIENFNDIPFSNGDISHEQFALMAAIICQVRRVLSIPIGVNVHFNDWKAEIALAFACKSQFVRVEVFVDIVGSSCGIVQPCCAEVMRYRKTLSAEDSIKIWADIHPKYSYNILPISLRDSAKMAESAMADIIIVTGEKTGMATPLDDIRIVKEVVDVPVFAGSGVCLENVAETLAIADGVIVGSAFKLNGNVYNEVSEDRIIEFMKVVNEIRK